MKAIVRLCCISLSLGGWAGGILSGQLPSAHPEVTAFGLRHTVVSNANLSLSSSMNLLVSQTFEPHSSSGSGSTTPFAVDIELGRAESGIFIYPAKPDPQNGEALEGWAYGQLQDGATGLLSGIRGRRSDWGEYEAVVDFSFLGASRYRFELYCDRYLIAQAERLPGDFVVRTIDIESYDPRVNPAQRLPDGRLAAVVEFPRPTLFVVTDGFRAGGNRLLIIPEDLTNEVDFVSSIRVVGSGGLQHYEIQDERLVLFGTPHRALGSAVFATRAGGFTMGHLDVEEGSGVLIEGGRSTFMSVDLAGATLDHPGQEMSVASSGTSSLDSRGTFLGPMALAYAHEAWTLSFVNSETSSTQRVVVDASLLGVPSGQDTVETDHAVGEFTTARLTVTRMGGFGISHTNRAGFFVSLAEPTTLITVASNQLMGDTFYVSLADPVERLGALESLSLMASGLAEFTITNESRILLPTDPLSLSIAATGPNRITVGWPYFPCNCFYLQSTTNFTPSSSINGRTTVYEEFEYRTSVDTGLFPQGYFDLHYNYPR